MLDQVERGALATLEETPKGATHWSRASMASAAACRESTIGRIWRNFELKPHLPTGSRCPRIRCSWKRSSTSSGSTTIRRRTRWCFCVDEKSQIQALDRSQPVLPMMPGMPERRTHDYARNGTTSLFAAFNIADGTVISEIRRRHRAVEYKKFLPRHRQGRPGGAGRAHRLRQPRHPQDPGDQGVARPAPPVPRAFHPDRLVLDQPGRAVVLLPHHPDAPDAASTRTSRPWRSDIRAWIKQWNEDPRPFVWKKTAEEILTSLAKYLQRI